jgi:hypothetical protein
MVSESERKKILEMIQDGTISAEEGLTLINALSDSQSFDDFQDLAGRDVEIDDQEENALNLSLHKDSLAPSGQASAQLLVETTSEADEYLEESINPDLEILSAKHPPPGTEEINKWKRWWVIPLWIGAGITVVGGLLMYWAFQTGGYGFWFACAWFPFLLGVAVLALAWSSRTSPWLHVRVHQAPGERPQKIAISFPIPVRLTVWGLRTFGHHIPQMGDTSLDEVIMALKDVAKEGTPFFVDVDEGENGERVQVFIG